MPLAKSYRVRNACSVAAKLARQNEKLRIERDAARREAKARESQVKRLKGLLCAVAGALAELQQRGVPVCT